MVRSVYQGKHFSHIKTKGSSLTSLEILSLNNSSILKKEIALKDQEIQQLKKNLEKYRQTNQVIKEKLCKNKEEWLLELWSIRTLIHCVRLIQLRGFIGIILFLNAFLLVCLFFFSFKKDFFQKNQTEKNNFLNHSVFFPYTIEVDVFDSVFAAQKDVIKLKSFGFRSYIGKVFQRNEAVYRVYVNEYQKLNDAQKDLKFLKKKYGYAKSFIRRKF